MVLPLEIFSSSFQTPSQNAVNIVSAELVIRFGASGKYFCYVADIYSVDNGAARHCFVEVSRLCLAVGRRTGE